MKPPEPGAPRASTNYPMEAEARRQIATAWARLVPRPDVPGYAGRITILRPFTISSGR